MFVVVFALAVLFFESAISGVPVFVMMPLTAVNPDCSLYEPQQTYQQLQILKNSGVTGIMSDTWWGIVEQNPQSYNFSGYVQLVNMAKELGLQYQAVMSFHSCGGNAGDTCNIPLPQWVLSIGNNNPSIWYTDREGNTDNEYISLFADNQQLFNGRTPLQCYSDFMQAFSNAMGDLLGTTIVDVEVSMGPAGEMRYPSYPSAHWTFCGIGEFQCYDKYALASLATAAQNAGQPDWGNGGPDNSGTYDDTPSQTGFFTTNGGGNNYQSQYGQFFIGWYASSLINHGNNVLSLAKSVFNSTVSYSGKIAGVHWWYFDDSHAAEVTAGYYNTNNINGYQAIAQMFASNGAEFDFTCMEMLDSEQPSQCECGPFELVQQTKQTAHAANIAYTGENALARYDQTAYNTIITQAQSLGYLIKSFTYLRLGPTLLQQPNLQTFQGFVAQMNNL